MFLLRHLDDSAIRQERVERLMAAGRYEEGMALIEEMLPREQWDATLTEMLDEVRREQGLNCHALADICVEERLFGHIPDFLPPDEAERMRFICHYAPLMPQPAALMKIFPRATRAYAKTKPNRVHYTILAECLKNIRSVKGGQDVVDALVAEFRVTYRRRSAMMQEMDKCGL